MASIWFNKTCTGIFAQDFQFCVYDMKNGIIDTEAHSKCDPLKHFNPNRETCMLKWNEMKSHGFMLSNKKSCVCVWRCTKNCNIIICFTVNRSILLTNHNREKWSAQMLFHLSSALRITSEFTKWVSLSVLWEIKTVSSQFPHKCSKMIINAARASKVVSKWITGICKRMCVCYGFGYLNRVKSVYSSA